MSQSSQTTCSACGGALERVQYFSRQLLTADDMKLEQEYFRQKLRRHNHYLHGWGVVCGCQLEPAPEAGHPWQVRVCPGYAITPQGDEVLIPKPLVFDLATGQQTDEPCAPCPCPPVPQPSTTTQRQTIYLAVRYSECSSRPVRVHPAGCACDDAACEYSRIRDDVCLAVLWEIPECEKTAREQQLTWLKSVQAALSPASPPSGELRLPQAATLTPPPCLCCDDPWVILAAIQLPADAQTQVAATDIDYAPRRVLLSESALYALVLAK